MRSRGHEHRLFDEDTEKALREIFESFPRSVEDYLVVSKNPAECSTCGEALTLAGELARIAGGKLKFTVLDDSEDVREKLAVRYVPAFIYGSRKRNIRYYGLPSGQEFAPFIYIHQYIATGQLNISGEVREHIEEVDVPLHIKVFVTPECPYCPIVVDAVNQMALLNDLLLVETIEAFEHPVEADMYGVMYVPFIAINDPSDWRKYGAKPIEVVNGYLTPEDVSRIILRAAKKAKRR